MDGGYTATASTVAGAGGPKRPIKIGVVGAGMIGQSAHLANFCDLDGCRVVALAELRPELGQKAAAKFGAPAVYEDHKTLLARDDIDAVVVVTRRPALGPIVRDALMAGKHVLSEKPAAHTVGDAERLAEIAAANNRTFAVGFMKRHDAGVARGKAMFDELQAEGGIGRVLLMRIYSYAGDFACGLDDYVMTDEPRPEGLELWPSAPAWLSSEYHADYAHFLNIYVHDLNLLRHFVGATPDVTAVDFRRSNGRLAMFDCGAYPAVLEAAEVASADWQEGIEILFEAGTLRVELPAPMLRNVPACVTLQRRSGTVQTIPPTPRWSWAFRRQAAAFVADVASGATPLTDGRDCVQDLVLAEDIWRRHLDRKDAKTRGRNAR